MSRPDSIPSVRRTQLCFGYSLVFALLTTVALAQASGARASDEWPEFRGPTGQGHATATNLPTEWSTTKNVVWKQTVPGLGWSSPVISRGRLYLTTGVASGPAGAPPTLRALCFDAATGKILWDQEVFPAADLTEQPIHKKNSPASPTPIIEDDRIYVHFGHHGTACLNRDGKVLWRNTSMSYDSMHGNGSTPIIVGDNLIFHVDAKSDPFAVALNKRTGEVRWKAPRSMDAKSKFSFATPLLITVKGTPQVISPASGAVLALDPNDGRELWRAGYGQGYSVVPRPVFGHGLVFIATGFNRADLLAIRVDGEGDVTDTHIVWRVTKGAPLTPSVVLVGDELYAVNDAGIASCFDAKTGTVHWQERIDGNYSASPIAVGNRLYFQSETGTGTVLEASRTFTKIATNQLEEPSLASYAVADNALFIRTEAHLYRIAEGGAVAKGQ